MIKRTVHKHNLKFLTVGLLDVEFNNFMFARCDIVVGSFFTKKKICSNTTFVSLVWFSDFGNCRGNDHDNN